MGMVQGNDFKMLEIFRGTLDCIMLVTTEESVEDSFKAVT